MRSNRLIVEIECADSKLLYDRDFSVHGLSFTNAPIRSRARLLARPRYRDPAQAVEFFPMENGRARVIFDGPQRAIASGQVIALYDGETLLGGGVFS
jgi:tRNA-specific 2-thiouridylase